MNKKRNRLEVIKDILKTINDSKKIKTTRLIHKSNLSPQMFKEYINELLNKNLIEKSIEKEKKYFILTKKGQEYLNEYKTFSRFIENFGI